MNLKIYLRIFSQSFDTNVNLNRNLCIVQGSKSVLLIKQKITFFGIMIQMYIFVPCTYNLTKVALYIRQKLVFMQNSGQKE